MEMERWKEDYMWEIKNRFILQVAEKEMKGKKFVYYQTITFYWFLYHSCQYKKNVRMKPYIISVFY